MNDSPVQLELSASYAYRGEAAVHVVLVTDEQVPPDAVSGLRLRSEGRTARGKVEVTPVDVGTRIEATVPRGRLGRGTWRLALRTPTGEHRRVEGRLLVAPRQPVVLVPGPAPRTNVEPPTRAAEPAAAHPVARRAARVLDRPLRLLPDRSAARVRRTLRGAARRVSG